MRKTRDAHRAFVREPGERDYLENLGLDGRIKLI
jgi:hypothetical protein